MSTAQWSSGSRQFLKSLATVLNMNYYNTVLLLHSLFFLVLDGAFEILNPIRLCFLSFNYCQ